MFAAAPVSITALLLASFVGLSLVILGAREPSRERALLVLGLGVAGFGAMGVLDVLFDLGTYPVAPFVLGAALMAGAALALTRSRA
jgi:predicted permease